MLESIACFVEAYLPLLRGPCGRNLSSCFGRVIATRRGRITASGFFDHFFDLANFFLDLSRYLFAGAFVFQVNVICRTSYFFLNRAFGLVNLACDLVFRAFFHLNLLSNKN